MISSNGSNYSLQISMIIPYINQRISQLIAQLNATLTSQQNPILGLLEAELAAYFAGTSKTFSVPLAPTGTPFQQAAWKSLQTIPHGSTSHYQAQASLLQPTAFRTCARANGCNWIAVVIPCHRVIKKNGDLRGYNGGLWRKEWLLKHESQNSITAIQPTEKSISF